MQQTLMVSFFHSSFPYPELLFEEKDKKREKAYGYSVKKSLEPCPREIFEIGKVEKEKGFEEMGMQREGEYGYSVKKSLAPFPREIFQI